MGDIMNEIYSTQYHKVILTSTISGHKVIFREMYFNHQLTPSHICAYVRLTPPFKSADEFGYTYETYREDDVFGVDTDHLFNQNQNMTQKLEDARRQITDLIQDHIDWQAEQDIEVESISEPEPPVKQQPICVRRFLNLEL